LDNKSHTCYVTGFTAFSNYTGFIFFYFRDANTIFRGNSLATRCLDEMMKIVGGHYLKVTLKSILDEVQSPLTAVHGYLTSLSRSDVLMGRFYPFMFY
jgi:hypothetical protein